MKYVYGSKKFVTRVWRACGKVVPLLPLSATGIGEAFNGNFQDACLLDCPQGIFHREEFPVGISL